MQPSPYHCLIPEHTYHPKKKAWTIRFHSHPLQTQAITHLLSISRDLPILEISYKWNHTIHGLLCPACFNQHVFKVHSHWAFISTLFFFYYWIIVYCMDIWHFVYPFTCYGHLGCVCSGAVEIRLLWLFVCKFFCEHTLSLLSGMYLWVELLGCRVT